MIYKYNSYSFSLQINYGRYNLSKYACSDTECGMAVADLKCGICNVALEHVLIEKDDGSSVGVAQCPKGCGEIKSPMCCGSDMNPI